jgi:hypothetical protein
MKPTTWLTALRRVTIIISPSRTTESAQRQVLPRQRIGVGSGLQHYHHRQRHEAHAGQHGRTDAGTTVSIVRWDAEPHDHPAQCDRNDDGLEDQCHHRRHVEVRCVLDEAWPGH